LTEPSEVIAIRPTRSANGAVGVTVDTASVLSLELCLPGRGGEVTSRDAMSALQEAGGNARWLLSRCPRCIADGSARRTSDPRAARGPGASGDSQRRVCQVAGGPPLVPRFTPAGNFALHRRVEQDPARCRLRFRSHSDDRAEAEAATVAVQMSIPWTYFSFSCWARSFSTKGHRNTRTPTPATRAAASVSPT
jgi:hypothetical protein